MKKIISFLFGILVVMSCSTSSDDNGNSTTTVVPVPPTNLIGTAASPTQINLSWTDNSTNETGFKIQRRTGFESYAIVGNANTDILTFSDTGLTPSTTYVYRVYSYNAVGNSPTYSNEVTVTTTATASLPTLTTTAASSIANTTAVSGGTISSDGGAAITSRGVCWSTNANPTVALTTKTIDGSGVGAFTSNITGLAASTMYYVRAYATNSVGTAYGNQLTITTTAATVFPILTTTEVSSIAAVTAVSGGTITNDGGAAITTRGVCWSTNANPTTALATKTNDGAGTGGFTSNITGLTANTAYYVRAYATNSVGTAYGNQVSFTTSNDLASSSEVTIGNQTWTTRNLDVETYRDGTPIPQVTDPTAWASLTTGAWCYNNNDPAIGAVYGKLYNWYAVAGIYDSASYANPALRKQLAPSGWHIPSDEEWTTLTDFLGGLSVASNKLREAGTIHWGIGNTTATNSSGFTALPGGYRSFDGVIANNTGQNQGIWWTSSSVNPNAFKRTITFSNVQRHVWYYKFGCSVRCVKD